LSDIWEKAVSSRRFRIVLANAARRDLERLDRDHSLQVCKDISAYLEINPGPIGKSRINKLSGFYPPLYRLRSGDLRVYYRLKEGDVVIMAVRSRKDSEKFLSRIKEERLAYGKKPEARQSTGRKRRA
jgi:mRNA-degrading endonuclease RelE of RelBE toxin-antitoxin system